MTSKQLWVTVQTVKFHLSNTYRKLGVSNRTTAARQAQLHGLLSETRPALRQHGFEASVSCQDGPWIGGRCRPQGGRARAANHVPAEAELFAVGDDQPAETERADERGDDDQDAHSFSSIGLVPDGTDPQRGVRRG
jgi:Bacterial regulatory proteins, luxR family